MIAQLILHINHRKDTITFFPGDNYKWLDHITANFTKAETRKIKEIHPIHSEESVFQSEALNK